MKEFIDAGKTQKIWLRLGKVLWTSFKDDYVLVIYADQYVLEIVKAKLHIYDVCEHSPTLSGSILGNGEMVHLLHIYPGTNYGVGSIIDTTIPDIYVVRNGMELNLKRMQVKSDNWELLEDGIIIRSYVDTTGDEWYEHDGYFFDIHKYTLTEEVNIGSGYASKNVGTYRRSVGMRWVQKIAGEWPTFMPVELAPVEGSVYLQNAGWWWRSGTYKGFTEKKETYYVDFNSTGELKTKGFGKTKGSCLFPSMEPSISLGVEVAFNTIELLNDRVSLFTFPLSNYVDNEVLVIQMPWRVGNPDIEGKVNPFPEFYMYPVEGANPALSFGCVDAASYELVDKELPMTGKAVKIGMKKITGRVTMHDNGPTQSIIHKTFSYHRSAIDYDNSYILSRKVTETGVEPDIIRTEWSYLNTERESTYDDVIRTSSALAQKFLVFTDGTNVIEKIPYLYYGPDGFYLEIHYTWNGKTSATSVFTYKNFHCTEEFHFFRYFDITAGMMVADVRVTDTIAGYVKWERRIYTPGVSGEPNTNYVTVFTYTSSEDNPITGLPDVRNIPPWMGEDADSATIGEFTSLMYSWAEPFIASYYAYYPPTKRDLYGPIFSIAATYFPAISIENISSVILLEYYDVYGSAYVARRVLDDVSQQNVVVKTDYGWAACMSSNWELLPGEIVYHYNSSSMLVKYGGSVSGIDPSAMTTVDIYGDDQSQDEYDYIPDPPP